MSDRHPSPKVKLATLYQRKAANGRTYFVGRMGAASVVLLRDDRAEIAEGDNPRWDLFASEPRTNTKGRNDGR